MRQRPAKVSTTTEASSLGCSPAQTEAIGAASEALRSTLKAAGPWSCLAWPASCSNGGGIRGPDPPVRGVVGEQARAPPPRVQRIPQLLSTVVGPLWTAGRGVPAQAPRHGEAHVGPTQLLRPGSRSTSGPQCTTSSPQPNAASPLISCASQAAPSPPHTLVWARRGVSFPALASCGCLTLLDPHSPSHQILRSCKGRRPRSVCPWLTPGWPKPAPAKAVGTGLPPRAPPLPSFHQILSLKKTRGGGVKNVGPSFSHSPIAPNLLLRHQQAPSGAVPCHAPPPTPGGSRWGHNSFLSQRQHPVSLAIPLPAPHNAQGAGWGQDTPWGSEGLPGFRRSKPAPLLQEAPLRLSDTHLQSRQTPTLEPGKEGGLWSSPL